MQNSKQLLKRYESKRVSQAAVVEFNEIVEMFKREKGITPAVIQFFVMFARDNWNGCMDIIAQIRSQSADLANEIEFHTKIDTTALYNDWFISIENNQYVAKNPNMESEFNLANFYFEIKSGVWFDQEKEDWISGVIHIAQSAHPMLIKMSDLDRQDKFMSACQAAIYTNTTGDKLERPLIARPALAPGLLQLLKQQVQRKSIIRGLAKLGWRDKLRFVAPSWIGTDRLVAQAITPVHPNNAMFRALYSQIQFKPKASPSVTGTGGALIAGIVAFLRRSLHGWPCTKINIRYTPGMEQLIKAVFLPLNQISPVIGDWKKLERMMAGYPVFTVEDAKVPDNYPAFCFSESGVLLPDNNPSDPTLDALSAASWKILSSCIPFLINERDALAPEQTDDFFKLAREGQVIIAACYGHIPVTPYKGEELCRYFAELPATAVARNITLDMPQQQIFLRFDKTTRRRKLVKAELDEYYPDTKPEYYGNYHLRIESLPGMELLQQFYGRDVPITRKVMSEKTEAIEDSESESSKQPNV